MRIIRNSLAYFRDKYACSSGLLNHFGADVSLLAARLTVAYPFLSSGLSKWSGFLKFDQSKYELFLYEFFCPDPVREGALLLCDATTLMYPEGSIWVPLIEGLAVIAGVVEVILPLFIILGLLTRLAAVGLIALTLFIQLAVYPDLAHFLNPTIWWLCVLFIILTLGPGRMAIDKLLHLER